MPSPDAVIRWYLEMEDHNQNINNDNDKEKKQINIDGLVNFCKKR